MSSDPQKVVLNYKACGHVLAGLYLHLIKLKTRLKLTRDEDARADLINDIGYVLCLATACREVIEQFTPTEGKG